MNLISFWEKESFLQDIDILIVGSGIVGLSTALEIKAKEPKLNVVVLERGFLPSGASTKNAGFACFGSVTELVDDLKTMSENEVFSIVEKRFKGLQNLRKLIGDQQMDFQNNGGYEVFLESEQDKFEAYFEKTGYLNQKLKDIVGKQVYSLKNEKIAEFGFGKVKNLIFNSYEGQINTGMLMKTLLSHCNEKGIRILNGVEVEKIEQNKVFLKEVNLPIKALKVVICNNGFAQKLLQLDVKPARAQVLITSPIENLGIKGTFHYESGYYYFRNVEDRILLGGGRNLAFEEEATTELKVTELIQNKLDYLLKEVILPKRAYQVEQRWAGIMGVGMTKKPIVQKINEHLYCAVRMGGMGVAIGTLVGKEAAEMVVGDL